MCRPVTLQDTSPKYVICNIRFLKGKWPESLIQNIINAPIYFVTTMLIGFMAVISVVLANVPNILNRQPSF